VTELTSIITLLEVKRTIEIFFLNQGSYPFDPFPSIIIIKEKSIARLREAGIRLR